MRPTYGMRTLLRTTAVIGLAIVVLRELSSPEPYVGMENLNSVRPGMSKSDVYSLLGPPRLRQSVAMSSYQAELWQYDVLYRGRRSPTQVLFCDGLLDWSIRDFHGLTIKRRKARNYVNYPAN